MTTLERMQEKIDFLLRLNGMYSEVIKSDAEMRSKLMDQLKEQYEYILELQSKLGNK